MSATGVRSGSQERRRGMRRDAGKAPTTRSVGRVPQLELPFPATWGGARTNAGRKPGPRRSVPHRARSKHRAWQPVHVTLRARIAQLRSQFVFPTIQLALLRATRRAAERFRIVHFSVQHNHVHLLVEASDRRALSSGMSGLAIRIACYVNDLLSRHGRFWAERWHERALTTPLEVRRAIVYVLANAAPGERADSIHDLAITHRRGRGCRAIEVQKSGAFRLTERHSRDQRIGKKHKPHPVFRIACAIPFKVVPSA